MGLELDPPNPPCCVAQPWRREMMEKGDGTRVRPSKSTLLCGTAIGKGDGD